jgi:hypothetical protein
MAVLWFDLLNPLNCEIGLLYFEQKAVLCMSQYFKNLKAVKLTYFAHLSDEQPHLAATKLAEECKNAKYGDKEQKNDSILKGVTFSTTTGNFIFIFLMLFHR